jgi:hypothetical protein
MAAITGRTFNKAMTARHIQVWLEQAGNTAVY